MLAISVHPVLDMSVLTGGLGLLARLLLPLIALLLLPRLAPGRARTLARLGLTVLLMGAILPRLLNAVLGWVELMTPQFRGTHPDAYALVHLLDDALYVAGLSLLLRALWLALPRKAAPPPP
ncbi:hypothetical protein [Xanthomonas sontii]|uniref:Uncharacterized protein n=1 Tax=Xanthomonas sontii TaxID=2650745 RepID=A0A6N7QAB7_9XANT|nr:hypothetical protein [Xanthomonas sontii]MDQ7758014.1 hypothetical protein [Xanthomonas sontii]MRH01224.1 hypothetical protein [Xanthomonas sontii]MRH75339.1 hypothetical protein [Xanthomonas sontii]TYD38062.1 hypothetical protein CEK63_01170 [Xanthomonas sontii]UZK05603.1 hypothetical protein CJ027_001875 [Xanthomonas sontii]